MIDVLRKYTVIQKKKHLTVSSVYKCGYCNAVHRSPILVLRSVFVVGRTRCAELLTTWRRKLFSARFVRLAVIADCSFITGDGCIDVASFGHHASEISRCTLEATCVFCVVASVGGISVYKNPYNNCCQLLSNEFFPLRNTPKSMSAGALPQTPLGELTALPRPPSWFQGGRLTAGGEWRGGEGRTGKGKGGERRNEEGRGKEGSWGNSALVLWGIDAPGQNGCSSLPPVCICLLNKQRFFIVQSQKFAIVIIFCCM